jgi:phosphomethylpyrimidine synthase
MKITKDMRKYAGQKQIDEQAALGVGMKEKAEEFVAAGARNLPPSVKPTLTKPRSEPNGKANYGHYQTF